MPKSDFQKLSTLYILEYLQENSDESHLVTTAELIRMLDQHGISCERKTIYSDIALLQKFGASIENKRGKNGGYYLEERDFQLSELKLLVNAVQSSRYLTQKKSREMVAKLSKLCSRYEAQSMQAGSVIVSGQIKNMNETIYYNIDNIQTAILNNQQIRFHYYDWGLDHKLHPRNKVYITSPYAVHQDHENCYLIAYSDREKIRHYRVDRMKNIEPVDIPRDPCPELTGDALTKYANRLFQMFSGTPTQVKLRFHRSLINAVFDRFGSSTILTPDGPDHVTFLAEVAVSPMFLSWIIGFGDKAQILHPQSVIDQCRELCQRVISQYPAE